jgi:CheY-like chemotaxis protein
MLASTPDVALVDIGLPDMDGYEVARRLRERLPELKPRLIAVTGYGQEADKQRARLAGFEQHLTKPVDSVVLEQALGGRASPGNPERSSSA